MAEYHVGCGVFGIYAGILNNKNKSKWQNKSEVTAEAIEAVRDYMVEDCLGGLDSSKHTGGYGWKLKDGRIVKLRIEIAEAKPEDNSDAE